MRLRPFLAGPVKLTKEGLINEGRVTPIWWPVRLP